MRNAYHHIDFYPLRHPLVLFFIPFAAGIVTAYYASGIFTTAVVAAIMIVSMVGLILSQYIISKKYSDYCLYIFCGMTLMSVGALLCLQRINATQVDWPQDNGDYLIGITSPPRHSERSQRVDAKILSGKYEGKLLRLYFPDSVNISTGDEVFVHTKIDAPQNSGNPHEFDNKGYLLQQGISGTGYVWQYKKRDGTERKSSLRQWGGKVREKLTSRYSEYFEGQSLAILAAMTIGDKNELTKEVQDIFSQVGASHLLALSGLHLGILFSIFNITFLRRTRNRYFRIVLSILGIVLLWTFAFIAGLPISLQRAALMFSLAQIMIIFRRDAFSINNLALSAIIILIINPLSLFDVGFQLSYASVLAILWIFPIIPCPKVVARYKVLRFFHDSLCVTFCATIGTAPLVAYYFHNFPVYGLIVNLVLVFFAYGILVGAILFFILPFATEFIAIPLNGLLKMLEATLTFFAELPGSHLKPYPTAVSVLLIYCLIFLYLFFRKKRKTLYPVATIICTFIIFSESYAHRPHRLKPQIVFYNLYGGNAIHFINNEEDTYLWQQGRDATRSLSYIEKTFWEEENIKTPVQLREGYDSVKGNASILFSSLTDLPKATDSLLKEEPKSAVISFHNKRVIALTGKIARSRDSTAQVDYLYVTKGFSGDPASALEHYSPKTLVISSSLGDKYRLMWKVSAREKNVTIKDMKESGALVVHL